VKFKQFYQVTKKIDFDKINKAMMESLQDIAFHASNKKGINLYLLMSEEALKESDFYTKFPHLA
jgi:hypothetical protein